MIACPPPPLVNNGVVRTQRLYHRYDDIIEYQCNLGYRPRTPSSTILRCNSNGQWDGSAPICDRKFFWFSLPLYAGNQWMNIKTKGADPDAYATFHQGLHCLPDNNVQGLCSIQSGSALFAKQLQYSGLKRIIIWFFLLLLSPHLVCRGSGRTIPLSHLANNLKILTCVIDK